MKMKEEPWRRKFDLSLEKLEGRTFDMTLNPNMHSLLSKKEKKNWMCENYFSFQSMNLC